MVIKDCKLVNLTDDEGLPSFWKLYFLNNKRGLACTAD